MPAGQRIDALLVDYGAYHQTRGNRVCHAFGIPLIVFGPLFLADELTRVRRIARP
ncbi:MAG: hypothetical protein ACRD1P_09505 [Thermoanaerobaculia bacterium]